VEDGDRLGMADARTYGTFLRSLIALDNGEPARARALHTEAGDYAVVATLPPIFEVGMRALSARILAAEGRTPPSGTCRPGPGRPATRRPRAEKARVLLDELVDGQPEPQP
ncbi:MAG: hypothetical protein ACRDP3_16730, partial [Streptomyces sp.]|uniref:hypothetical protein n=1 Tax=Streptomyces sp. TaxID=1931 RepID=UPI003D6C6DF8